MRFKQIAFCSDFLMTSDSEQWSNLRWMKDLLTRPIHASTNIEPHLIYTGTGPGSAFAREEFFALSEIKLQAADTPVSYTHLTLPTTSRV